MLDLWHAIAYTPHRRFGLKIDPGPISRFTRGVYFYQKTARLFRLFAKIARKIDGPKTHPSPLNQFTRGVFFDKKHPIYSIIYKNRKQCGINTQK